MKFFGLLSLPFFALGLGFLIPVLISLSKAAVVNQAFKWVSIAGFGVFAFLNATGLIVRKVNHKKKKK